MHPPTHRYPLTPSERHRLPFRSLPLYSTILPVRLESWRSPYIFNAHTDIKELALYVRDNITIGKWSLNSAYAEIATTGLPSGSNSNSCWSGLQRQENQHDRPHFLRPHSGISL